MVRQTLRETHKSNACANTYLTENAPGNINIAYHFGFVIPHRGNEWAEKIRSTWVGALSHID